ncbi:hypothetical protein DRH14_00065 [Candidatus Shapirobacteria bacterium]|nr:MAG: hypothetical protein DRH14_00065 [Candidatus Shapirobacteria bacterium]
MINLKQYRRFLTKNERNKVYLKKNSARGRAIADKKWKTKKILAEAGVGVPSLIRRFKNYKQVTDFKWEELEGNFVVKPASGYGGEGIVVVRKRAKWAGEWRKMDGEIVNVADLRLHCREILEGRYSLHGMRDTVLVEERIKIHPKFLCLTKTGTPDVRVIVYNNVPVMAMLRVPTAESGGKSNLQQGAVGLGIDLATGITTFGVKGKKEMIRKIYDYRKKKKIKVNGIRVPEWEEILKTAIECQMAISSLGFMGIDILLDKDKGPMVLEVNARPGLSIQLCNRAGLGLRLRRVEGIEVRNVRHGVKLAKYLFAESFFEKVEAKDKKRNRVLEALERVKIKTGKGRKNRVELRAKVDTGAFRSSIDEDLARQLGLLGEKNVLYYRHYRSSLGKHNDRPVIALTFWLKGRLIKTAVNVANRSKLRTKFLLGRKDLKGFLVKAIKD